METPRAPTPVAEAGSLAYAQTHKLHEMIDMLICEVASARPANPVSFMGALLQRKIALRDGMGQGDDQLAAALPMYQHGEDEGNANGDGQGGDAQDLVPNADGNTRTIANEKLAQFGLWVYIRYADLKAIVSRFQQLLQSRSLAVPAVTDAQNMEFFIQMLAMAMATAHFKGMQEAIKLLPTRTVRLNPHVCEALTEAILEFAQDATASQRSDFIKFMRLLTYMRSRTTAAHDASVIQAICGTLQSSDTVWDRFITTARRELARMDPVMEVFGNQFSAFVKRLIEFAQGIIIDSDSLRQEESMEALRLRAQKMYTAEGEAIGLDVVPDRFAVHGSLFMYSLEATLDEHHLTATATDRLNDILLNLLGVVNAVAAESHGERWCVRNSGAPLLASCAQIFSCDYTRIPFTRQSTMAGYETSFRQSADDLLRSAVAPLGVFTDDMAAAFVKVGTVVVAVQRGCSGGGDISKGVAGSGGTVIRSAALTARCYHEAYRSLLQLLVAVVQCRGSLTAKGVLTILARSLCHGAPPSSLFLHFQSAFTEAVPLAPSERAIVPAEREKAKTLLQALQSICVEAVRCPVVQDVALSLQRFVDHALLKQKLTDALATSGALHDLPAETLSAFIEADRVVATLQACFADPSPDAAVERYFEFITLTAARLRLCRVYFSEDRFCGGPTGRKMPPPECEFLSMALLSASQGCASAGANSTLSPQRVAPALEAFTGLGPALFAAVPSPATARDRAALLTYFQHSNANQRLLLRAVEELLRVFPSYQPRLLHSTHSFEELQRAFHDLLLRLLAVPGDNAATESTFTTLLKPVAVQMAIAGAQPRDYDIMGLCLCRVLRARGFPEREWATFYVGMVDRVVALTPSLRPITSYGTREVAAVSTLQRAARSRAARRASSAPRVMALRELLRALRTDTLQRRRRSSELSSRGARRSIFEDDTTVKVSLHLVYLSWKALTEDDQAMIIYHAALAVAGSSSNTNTGDSTDMSFSQLEQCRTVASSLSLVIDALGQQQGDEVTAAATEENSWRDVFTMLFGDRPDLFLEGCVAPAAVPVFARHLVDNVCEKLNCRQFTLRASWLGFMESLTALITSKV